jgi:cytochrome c peroxidase
MKKIKFLPLLFMLIIAVSSCNNQSSEKEKVSDPDQLLIETANRYFATLPDPGDPNAPEAILGKKLYNDNRLSANGEMSCNTCHPIANYGVDNLPTSPGHDGTLGTRNSPTTFNAWFHTTQFWDGRSPDLADQAKGPVLNPIEMGMKSAEDVIAIMRADEEYQQLFAEAFPQDEEPITFDRFADAIAAFEGTLATPAAFDSFLSGVTDVMTDDQKEGLTLFIETGCIACHIGPGLGGTMMQRFGLVHGPYYEYTNSELKDKGVAEVTGKEGDEFVFKTPSLRNIEKTAPYFHDGSTESLHEAVKIMAYTQLGRELTDDQTNKLVEFFKSLTGKIPEHAL